MLLLVTVKTVAQTSVTLAPASITVIELLQTGRSYRLPPVSIANNGARDLELVVTYTTTTPGVIFQFRPQNFILRPGDSQQVSILLQLAPSISPGDYIAFIQAENRTEGDIALQLAAPVRFTVDRSDGFKDAWILPWLSLPIILLLMSLFNRAKRCRS